MPVGQLILEIQLPYAHSLKEKRAVLQKLMSRLQARFNVAVAELDHQDVWQRATVAVVTVSGSQPLVDSSLRQALEESERILGQDVSHFTLEFY